MGQSKGHWHQRNRLTYTFKNQGSSTEASMLVEFRYYTLRCHSLSLLPCLWYFPSGHLCPSKGSYTSYSPAAWRIWTYILVSWDLFLSSASLNETWWPPSPWNRQSQSLLQYTYDRGPTYVFDEYLLKSNWWEKDENHSPPPIWGWVESRHISFTASQNPSFGRVLRGCRVPSPANKDKQNFV